MKNETKIYNVTFFEWLTLLFIGLKLTGHIDWGIGLILAPLWIPLSVALVLAFVVALYQTIKENV